MSWSHNDPGQARAEREVLGKDEEGLPPGTCQAIMHLASLHQTKILFLDIRETRLIYCHVSEKVMEVTNINAKAGRSH